MIRYKMIRGFMTTVVALFCLSATAGKVEVIGDGSQGTVDWKAEGAVITLTVTPTEGNFIRKNDITITKTFMPTAARRRAEVPIGDGLTLVGADPDDLSLPRTYTVTMPGEEYDLLVRLQFSNCQIITESMVRLSETVFVYNENAQRPKVFVSGLTEGTDFTVTYDNPASASAGEYGITIKGRSTWTGTVRRTYKIFTGGKAEVNKSIEGGTIATAVDGLTVMLTVTPTDGYYIRKQDIAVAKTYMPVAASRRSIPVADRLELTGDDPDDLSLPRTYTAQLSGWEYSAYVDAMFTERQTLTESMVTLSATSFVYNTSDQKPTISVTGLTEGKDFLVAYNGTSWADVDTYMVTITGRSTWKGTISRTWQITKAPSEVTTVPMAQSLIYSKTAQQLVNTGDAIGGTLVYGLDNTALQPVIPTGVDAGNYTVYYRVLGDANHFDSEIESVLVTIAKKAINISGITAQDKVYDGTTAATLGFDQVVYGGIVSGDNLTITAKGAFADANAGTDKNVIITELTLGGTSIANYQLAESGQQTTATATITPRSIEGAVLSNIVAQTFTGDPLTPAVSVTLDGNPLTAGTDYRVTYANNVAVGEATLTVTGIGNYQGSLRTTFAIVPTMAQVITAPAGRTLIYDGTEQELVIAGEADGGTLVYSLDGTTYAAELPLGKMVNSYTISYKVQGDANHNDTEPVTIESTINKAAITISGITAQDKEYDGTTAATLGYDQVVYGGIVSGDNLTITAVGEFADADTGTEKTVNISQLTLGGTSIANYQLAESGQQTTATATITPRSIEGAILSDIAAQPYTGEPLTPAVSVTLDGTTLTAGTDYRVTYANNVNAGEATLTVTGIGNYQGSVQKTFTITVLVAVVITDPQPQTLVYSGEAQQLVTAGEAEGGTMVYSLDGTDYQTAIPTGVDAKIYTVYYKVQGDSNHSDTEVKSVTATITPRSIEGAVLSVSAQPYTGEPLTPAVSVTLDGTTLTAGTDYRVAYANNVNVGEATVIVTGIGNYQGSVQTSFAITITSVVAVVITDPQPQTLVYSGEAQQLVTAGEADGGTMLYSLDGTDYQEAIPTGVDAKTYTVYYMVQGDSNHTDSESASVNVTIAPKEVLQPTILLSTTDYTYDGTAKEPDVTLMDGEAVIAASEYTVGYANNINAGKATVTITDKEGGNYVVNGSTSFTISKVPSVITQEPQPLALDHTGEAQTLVVAGEAEGGTMVYSLDGETFTAELPSGTDAGIYTVSYKVQGDNNHSDTEVFTLKSSITPAMADESGKEVDADFIEGEDGGIEVIINTLPDNFWENTDAIPSTVSDENGNKYEVTLVSAEAFDNMPSDIIVVLPEGMSTTDPVPNVINGDGTCETLDLTNVSGLSLPIDVEAEKVVYDREVTGESTTICLPYNLPVPENTTAYVLDNTDSYGITLEKYEGVLEANQPYVLMMKETASARRRGGDDTSSVINLGTSNVTISHSAEEGSMVKNNFTLCGTLHSMTHEEGLEKKAYIMLPDNSWRMTASSDPAMAKEQYLAPFQAYLLYTGVGELEEISTSIDSSTTGVQTARPNITQSPRDGWYDMNGRKLNGMPTRKGAYLHQGKVIIL